MPYMAYDPALVDGLRSALAASAGELQRMGCPDPAAIAATGAVRRARSLVAESWLPLLDAVRACAALTDYRPVGTLDPADLEKAAIWAAKRTGWLVATDPRAADGEMTVQEAIDLAIILDDGDPTALIDTAAERAALADALQVIARDPAQLVAFRTTFHAWGPLADAAAARRAVTDERLRQQIDVAATADDQQGIDAVLAGLAAVLPPASALGELATMQSRAAALLVTHLPLAGAELAAAAQQIVQQYYDEGLGDAPNEYDVRPRIGDILYPVLAADGAAANAFLVATIDAPAFLWYAATDHGRATDVLAAGTQPAVTGAADAGRVLLAHIAFSRDDGAENWEVPRPALAAVIAPWLLQFSPLNDDWGAGDREKADILRYLVDDEETAGSLVGAMQRAVTGEGPQATVEQIRQLAALVGLLGTLDVYEKLADARDARNSWDLGFELIAMATNIVPGGTLAQGVASAGVDAVHRIAGTNGWLAAPSVCTAQRSADLQYRYGLAVSQAMLLTAYVEAARAGGLLPSATPPPPAPDPTTATPLRAWSDAYAAWQRRCAVAGVVLPIDVGTVGSAFVNALKVGEETAEVDEDRACAD